MSRQIFLRLDKIGMMVRAADKSIEHAQTVAQGMRGTDSPLIETLACQRC